MDIMLRRILALIPKKENGDFKHGAQSHFARQLGFKDGHIISDWISGNSTSYKNYLYQISAMYNVSVAWLRGDTDNPSIEKAPGQEAEGKLVEELPEDIQQLISICRKNPGIASALLNLARQIEKGQAAQG